MGRSRSCCGEVLRELRRVADIPIAESLKHAHPVVTATLEAAQGWGRTQDQRLAPRPEPGLVEARVARESLDRALRIMQTLIDACSTSGMEVAALQRARTHRAGVGFGRVPHLTAIRIEEVRYRMPFAELDLEQWRNENVVWDSDEDRLRTQGWIPRASGRLRLRLPRRHDRPPRGETGWRFSFTDQVGRPLEAQLSDVLAALDDRSRDAADAAG